LLVRIPLLILFRPSASISSANLHFSLEIFRPLPFPLAVPSLARELQKLFPVLYTDKMTSQERSSLMAGSSHTTGPGSQEGKSNMGQKTQETASNLGQKAREMASNVSEKAQTVGSAVAEKTDDAISAVGSGMTSLAGTIREKGPHSGMLGSAASGVASGLQASGEYLREHGMGDMLSDLTGVIRRYPIQSLLVGFGMGFLLARVTKRG
jgi:hypothetical protein